MLTETGLRFTLDGFQSCVGALEELRSAELGPVDAVIINEVLPIFELRYVLEELRGMPDLADAKYAVTVLEEQDAERVPAGCEVLVKPITPEALLRFLLGR